MRSFCTVKASHIYSTKNIGIFEILTFEILHLLTNDVNFEQRDPDLKVLEDLEKIAQSEVVLVVDCKIL